MVEWIHGKPHLDLRKEPRVPTGPPKLKPKAPLVLTTLERNVIRLLLHEHLDGVRMAERLSEPRWKIKQTVEGLYAVLELRGWGSARVRLFLWAFYNREFNPDAPERPEPQDGWPVYD